MAWMAVAEASTSRSLQLRAKFQNHDSQSRDRRGRILKGELRESASRSVFLMAPGWHSGSTWLGQM